MSNSKPQVNIKRQIDGRFVGCSRWRMNQRRAIIAASVGLGVLLVAAGLYWAIPASSQSVLNEIARDCSKLFPLSQKTVEHNIACKLSRVEQLPASTRKNPDVQAHYRELRSLKAEFDKMPLPSSMR
jgi:hypothetical protein